MLPKHRARRGRSEGSIYQRSDGRWVGSVSLGTHGGKRVRRVVYGETKAEAAAKLRAEQLGAGRLPDAHAVKLEEWLGRWLTNIQPTVEPATHGAYRRQVDGHIVPRIGGMKLRDIRLVDVEAFFSRCLSDRVSPAMVRKLGTTLSVAFNHAVRVGMLTLNPARGARRPIAKRPKIHVLTGEQAMKLVQAAKRERLGVLIVLILDAGCRPGEALALTWQDVDFAGERITIDKSLEEICGRFRVKAPKTASGRRTVDLTAGTMDALNRHRAAMLAEGRDVRKGPVFVGKRGGRIGLSLVRRDLLKPLCHSAGVPMTNLYSLRHTCATMLLAANINPKIVSERLGHGSVVITMDTYFHVLPGMQVGAVEAISAALGYTSATSDLGTKRA